MVVSKPNPSSAERFWGALRRLRDRSRMVSCNVDQWIANADNPTRTSHRSKHYVLIKCATAIQIALEAATTAVQAGIEMYAPEDVRRAKAIRIIRRLSQPIRSGRYFREGLGRCPDEYKSAFFGIVQQARQVCADAFYEAASVNWPDRTLYRLLTIQLPLIQQAMDELLDSIIPGYIPPARTGSGLVFKVDTQEVFWQGERLAIRKGGEFSILKCLWDAEDRTASHRTLVATYREIDRSVTISRSDPSIRTAMSSIRSAFRCARAPYDVTSDRSRGYRLHPIPSQSKSAR